MSEQTRFPAKPCILGDRERVQQTKLNIIVFCYASQPSVRSPCEGTVVLSKRDHLSRVVIEAADPQRWLWRNHSTTSTVIMTVTACESVSVCAVMTMHMHDRMYHRRSLICRASCYCVARILGLAQACWLNLQLVLFYASRASEHCHCFVLLSRSHTWPCWFSSTHRLWQLLGSSSWRRLRFSWLAEGSCSFGASTCWLPWFAGVRETLARLLSKGRR